MIRLLVLGGARSGKSRYAQTRIEQAGIKEPRIEDAPARLAYIATAQALDAEMADRISRHRADRGPRWRTWDAPLDLPRAIAEAARAADAILVDCLTLWLSNLMLAEWDIARASDALAEEIATCPVPIALVANEVGLGIVPDNALARRFRDEAGWLNQRLAATVEEVVLVSAGLPLRLKPAVLSA